MLTIDEAGGRVILHAPRRQRAGACAGHAGGVRGGVGRLAALRLGREIRLWLHLDGPAGHPVSGRHDPHPGGDLAPPARRGRGNRRRAWRLAGVLRQPVRGDGPRPGDRRRCRNPAAQPRRDRGASAGAAHHADRGQLHRPGDVRQVRAAITPGERVLVVLDFNHSRAHVAAELELYSDAGCAGLLHRRLRRHHGAGRRCAAHRAGLVLEQSARRRSKRSCAHIRTSCWRNPVSRSTKARCATASPTGRTLPAAGAHEGGDPRRRPGHAHLRGIASAAEADDRDRRPADPVAHHEHLHDARGDGLRHLPRLSRPHDQGILRQLHAACVGRDGRRAQRPRSPITATMPNRGASRWWIPARTR